MAVAFRRDCSGSVTGADGRAQLSGRHRAANGAPRGSRVSHDDIPSARRAEYSGYSDDRQMR